MGDPAILGALRLKISRENWYGGGENAERYVTLSFGSSFVLIKLKVRILEVLYSSLIDLDYILQFSLMLQPRLSQNLVLTGGSLHMTA